LVRYNVSIFLKKGWEQNMKVQKQKYLQEILFLALLIWLSVGIKDEIWPTSDFLLYSDVQAYSRKKKHLYKNTKEFADYEKSHPLEYYEEEAEGKLFLSVVETIKPAKGDIAGRYGIEIEYTADCEGIKEIRRIDREEEIQEFPNLLSEGWKKLGTYPLVLDNSMFYWKIVSGTTAVGVGTKDVATPLVLTESLPPSILVNWYYKEEKKEDKSIVLTLYIDITDVIPSFPNLMLEDLKLPKETEYQLRQAKNKEGINGFVIANYRFNLEGAGYATEGSFAIEFPFSMN